MQTQKDDTIIPQAILSL